mgnify:CR=1 FL=1
MSAGQYKLVSSKGEGYIEPTEVISNGEVAKSYKVMITRIMAEHAGEPDRDGLFSVLATIRVLRPKEVCTDTYVTAGCFSTIGGSTPGISVPAIVPGMDMAVPARTIGKAGDTGPATVPIDNRRERNRK